MNDTKQTEAAAPEGRLDALVGRLRDADSDSVQRMNGSRIFGEAADEIERMRAELESVLEWALTEKAPLRAQEIASIRRVLTSNASLTGVPGFSGTSELKRQLGERNGETPQ